MKRAWIAKAASSVLAPLMVLALAELALRLAWSNPYRPPRPVDAYLSRMNTPGSRATAKIAGLYEGAVEVRGEITRWGSLSNGNSDAAAPLIAIGGSTTETALVAEGERWPDLLEQPAMNFGVAENCAIDSSRSLRYLLEELGLRPRRILLMHGINDLTEMLRAPSEFSLQAFPRRPIGEMLAAEADRVILGIRVRKSSLLSWLSFRYHNARGRDVTGVAPESIRESAPPLADRHLLEATARLRASLPAREAVYRTIAELAERHGAGVVLMTQPHSLREDYRPYRAERRLRRPWREGWMSHAQHAKLLDIVNQHTRSMATDLGVYIVDVVACFGELDPSPLFFDSVHYTRLGSHEVARCVNEGLAGLDDAGLPTRPRATAP